MASSSVTAPNSSCLARMQNYFCSTGTKQWMKTAFWYTTVGASIWIPIPFLNGFIPGAAFFKGTHELVKTPGSSCTMTEGGRRVLATRTWKDIGSGAAINGLSWMAARWIFSNYTNSLLLVTGATFMVVGTVVAFNIAYRDFWSREENHRPQAVSQAPEGMLAHQQPAQPLLLSVESEGSPP